MATTITAPKTYAEACALMAAAEALYDANLAAAGLTHNTATQAQRDAAWTAEVALMATMAEDADLDDSDTDDGYTEADARYSGHDRY